VTVAAVAIVAGWLAAWLALRGARPILWGPRCTRTNYRGRPVSAVAGAVLLASAGVGLAAALRAPEGSTAGATLAAAAIVMGALGLVDDLYGGGPGGGFAGHLRALARGRVTTGLVKAAGGGVVGLAAAWALGLRGPWVVAGGALVALTTNLVNLLDLRPGRAGKVWFAAWAATVASGWLPVPALAASGAVAGGLAALLPDDLGERAMLGDTGANLLGAALGVSLVAALPPGGMLVALGAVAVLTALSEVVSFSTVIERVPPLRALDRLGREGVGGEG